MKSMSLRLFVSLVLLNFSVVVHAGPNASGGIPETAFQHDAAALHTIFENWKMISEMSDSNAGSIKAVVPVRGQNDVFKIVAENCTVKVQFQRPCVVDQFNLPQCEYKSEVIEKICK